MELTVIGGGVGGSALVREAWKRGHEAKLISSGSPASDVALAVVRETYAARYDGGREACRYALKAYEAAGAEVLHGALVSTYNIKQANLRDDWHAVLPSSYLLQPDDSTYMSPDWKDPRADYTIWATGAAGIEGTFTFGATWVHDDPQALNVEFAIHQYAPYRTADAVRYSSGCRIGSSSAATLEKAVEGAHRIAAVARERGWVTTERGWKLLTGVRVQRAALATVSDGRVTFGGFHRDGWALAPMFAAQLIERLERGDLDLYSGTEVWLGRVPVSVD